MLTSKKDVDPFFLIIISAFGILASACSYYLNRGGKFWQENWEMHVNYLSSFINGNLFKIVPKKNEDHFSVSRINLFFSGAICILWLFIFVYYLTNFMDLDLGLDLDLDQNYIISFIFIFVLIAFLIARIISFLEYLFLPDKKKYIKFSDQLALLVVRIKVFLEHFRVNLEKCKGCYVFYKHPV